ncbi:hypothetical protein M3Y94_00303100 [Aphelenchoides besseyi]|nr:hypothetical protein M3Y94_00303100 [Aphelenchoides besseyi]
MELNMSRNIHHDTGVFGDDCNHVPRCLESKKKGRTRVPITNPDDQRRMPLLPDYFKPTTIGTLKLVVEDHVYFEMPSHTGYWNCMNTFQNLCTAFATIHGDELVLNHEHTDECDRRTAEYLNLPKRILENINPNSFVYSQLDETSVKRNSAGNIVSFVLGDHKYCRTMNGDPTETWRCTIDYCYAHAYLFEEEMVACESVAIHTCKRVRMQQMKTNPFPQYDNENIQIPAGIFEQLTESNFMRHEDGTIYEVIIDNQRYRKYHQNNKGYWKCIKENCNVRLYMDNNFQFYAFGASVHNHKKRIRRKSVKT